MREGDSSKPFVLKDQNRNKFNLEDFKDHHILLSFHPLAWTSICAEQMKSLEKNKTKFKSSNMIAVGISVDAVPTKKAWAKSLNIKETRLLSDFWPHGEVAQLYDVFRFKDGFSERANIVIDEKQTIIFYKVYPLDELPDVNEVLKDLF